MPKTKLQNVAFTVMMVFVMVYAMIIYNISLDMGGLQPQIFLLAFHEIWYMAPIAFLLEFFLVGNLAKKIAFKTVDPAKVPPIFLIVLISSVTVCLMCPSMSLAATILINRPQSALFVTTWLQITALNFPMALCWQLFFAGPLVRKIFRTATKALEKRRAKASEKNERNV